MKNKQPNSVFSKLLLVYRPIMLYLGALDYTCIAYSEYGFVHGDGVVVHTSVTINGLHRYVPSA